MQIEKKFDEKLSSKNSPLQKLLLFQFNIIKFLLKTNCRKSEPKKTYKKML